MMKFLWLFFVPFPLLQYLLSYMVPILKNNEDERTVLYKTKSPDGTKPNTNPNPKLTQILTLLSCFMRFSSTVS